jgi:predicted ATPase/DNA-binding CsgD family transcriptional regulator
MDHAATGLNDRQAMSSRGLRAPLRMLPVEPTSPLCTADPQSDRPAHARGAHNLPHPLTSFIGRAQEIGEAQRLLAGTRLLTLTGAGGVGKTRLGQEVAASYLDEFADGVWIVELSALTDAALVPQAVATTLGVHEAPEQTLTLVLTAALAPRQLLLVLDNCEHLIDACATLAELLLRACPALRIMATSREALGIAGETTFQVPSLSLGAPSGAASASQGVAADDLAEAQAAGDTSEAVRLFVERAQAAMPAFALTARNAAAVEQICQRLDGIPLAIELAAARVVVLSPDQIAARLGDRFHLLSGGSRTALPRYRTLRALLDWSHDLLDEQERMLLRRLAVFAGGWTLEAAESVCAVDGLGPDEILDPLSGLVAKSLVATDEQAGEVRYRFLESLREYAAEKLREAGEEATLRARHVAWCLALAERAESHLDGTASDRWLGRLEHERENVRAALASCIERADAEIGLRLAGALTQFWFARGPYGDIRGVLADLLALPSAQQCSPPVLAARAKALFAAGRLAMRQDDCAMADDHFQEALEISQQLGDRCSLAVSRFSVGHVARVRGEYQAARRHHAEAIGLFRALGDDRWLAAVYHDLGLVMQAEGELGTARAHYKTALALSKGLGDEPGIAQALSDLGEVAMLCGELAEAHAQQSACLTTARRLDDKKLIARTIGALAGLAVAQRRPTRALRLIAAATALNEAMGLRHAPGWHAMLDRRLEASRLSLGSDAAAAALAIGRAMPLDEAMVYALSADPPAIDAPRPGMPVANAPSSGRSVVSRPARPVAVRPSGVTTALTSREQEVAALVARGMTNRQIAADLVITEGTAANHVKHILARLTLDSRVQIATWAIHHGLNQTRLA